MFLLYIPVIISLAIGAAFFVLWFNRDPERHPPEKTSAIISPADGRVLYVKVFSAGELPVSKKFSMDVRLHEFKELEGFARGGFLVGIYLSPFDVHITRAPISGRVIYTEHTVGQLFSRTLFSLKTADERGTCVIKGDDGITVGVVQMAAYLVRRVILSVQDNAQVNIGQRIGKIRLGSQVDLVLPASGDVSVVVRAGDRVRAGESIIATRNHA